MKNSRSSWTCTRVSARGAAGLFLLVAAGAAHAQNAAVTISVDVNANRHPISPLIYGMAYAGANTTDLNCPINRYGGNNASRYNWQQNADNRGADWYFQSIADDSSVAGERGDTFVRGNKAAGADSMLTIPLIGWVARVNADRSKRWSFSIAKYGAQQGNDWQWCPDAGNGVLTSGANVTGNDPNDANVPADVAFQKGWIQHLTQTFGLAGAGGVRYYIMDNEHSIWHSTHRDVHPTGATMDEIWQKMRDHAAMIKGVDPNALIVGPEEWGWSGYFYSGYDQQYEANHGWSVPPPDRGAHNNQDYVAWLLQQFKSYDATNGKRLLDVFSLHYYPQGGEFSDDTSSAMQLRRNRSTRSLWDPAYTDETWINDRVQLIPRMKQWVSTLYPGTKTGITEYNWGAEGSINGATTQADILGIFGREGLDVAARWTTPDPGTPTYKAIKMFRNYDGSKGGFGDTSIAATAPNPDNLSTFASQDSATGTVKLMVVSKVLTGTTPVTVNVANFTGGTAAQVWQLTASNAITHLANATISNGKTVTLTVPAQSVTLLVLPKAAVTPPPTVGTGLKGSYFANMALTGRATFIRTDGVVDFSWGSAAPAPMLPADHFSVRWEGQVSAPVAGPYTFYTLSDDGVRLWVNGVQLINNWTNHGPTTDMAKASVMLTAGQKVSIKLEYYENTAGADAHLYWTYPNQPKQVVPKACLYPAP